MSYLSQVRCWLELHTQDNLLAGCAGAERAGYDVLVISVDTPRMGKLDPAEYNKYEPSILLTSYCSVEVGLA